jgi:uncharacterized protein YjbI with pentapeptide repeats
MNKKDLDSILELHKKWLNSEIDGVRVNLRGADLRGADLRGADLRRVNLTATDLTGSDLRWANLTGANLTGSNLGANLTATDLRGADLTRVDLRGANLSEANLGANCNLSSAKTDFKFLQVAGIGSKKRSTLYIIDFDKIFCGCFEGTLEEFKSQIEKTHANNKKYLEEYRNLVYYFELQKRTWELGEEKC